MWRDSINDPVKTFELSTVTYGTAAAPFLSVRCLKQLAIDEAEKFPLAAPVFQRDFYVDDLLTGTNDFESTLKLRDQLIALAKAGGFHLRQWTSNNIDSIKDLDSQNN